MRTQTERNKKLTLGEILLTFFSGLCFLFLTASGMAAYIPENPFMYFYKKLDGVNPVYVGLFMIALVVLAVMYYAYLRIKKY